MLRSGDCSVVKEKNGWVMYGLSVEVRKPKRWANIIQGRREQAYKDVIPQMVGEVYHKALVPQIVACLAGEV